MACSSCSSGAPSNTLVPHNACGCSSNPAPPRVANPPTVPVKFEWVSRVRNFLCGRLAIFQKDGEVGALQSSFSGQLVFGANTQTVSVADLATDAVNDNFGCQTSHMFGFPVIGLAPNCRDIGEYPPRAVAVARPMNSQQGEILGALADCPRAPGLTPEIAMVKVAPKALEVGLSDGTLILPQTIGFTEEVSFDCAGSRQLAKKWYSYDRWMQPNVDGVAESDILSGEGTNVTITAWRVKTVGFNTTKEVIEMTLDQLKEYLGPASIAHVTPWAVIGSVDMNYNALQDLVSFTPNALSGYLAKYKTMWLRSEVVAGTIGADYNLVINLDSQEIHNGDIREERLVGVETHGGVDMINPTYVFPYPIGDPGTLKQVKKILTPLTPDIDTEYSTNMRYKLSIVGWQ